MIRRSVIRNKARKEALKREQVDRRYPFVMLTTKQYSYYPVGNKWNTPESCYESILNY